jgi:hypothetical protein
LAKPNVCGISGLIGFPAIPTPARVDRKFALGDDAKNALENWEVSEVRDCKLSRQRRFSKLRQKLAHSIAAACGFQRELFEILGRELIVAHMVFYCRGNVRSCCAVEVTMKSTG